jgi:hypothetical protein
MAHLSNTAPSQQVHQQQQQRLQRHMFAVSPDYCVNMVQYYLGSYAQGRFDLQGADGPFPLDLGASMYAPNVLTDKQVGLFVAQDGCIGYGRGLLLAFVARPSVVCCGV